MPPVTLHQPAEGLDRGDTYSGPNEEWLVANGYASRAKGEDGLHVTAGQAKNDQTLRENREAPDKAPPTTDVADISGNPERFKAPEVDPLDDRQRHAKEIEAKLQGVEKGDRPEVAPDVVLADSLKAMRESRDYDGTPDEALLKRQNAAAKTFRDSTDKDAAERDKAALKAARENEKANQLGGGTAPDEDRVVEDGVGTDAKLETTSDDNKPVGNTPRNPLLAEVPFLDPAKTVSANADVVKAQDRPRASKTGTPAKK